MEQNFAGQVEEETLLHSERASISVDFLKKSTAVVPVFNELQVEAVQGTIKPIIPQNLGERPRTALDASRAVMRWLPCDPNSTLRLRKH